MLYAAEREKHVEERGYRKTRKYGKKTHPRALRVIQCKTPECGKRFKRLWLNHKYCDCCADELNRAMGDATP